MSQDSPSAEQSTGQAYLLFGIVLFLILIVGVAIQMLSPHLGLAMTELLLILLPALIYVRRKGLPFAQALRMHPTSVTDALLGIAVGVTGWGAAYGIYQLVTLVIGNAPEFSGFEVDTVGQWLLLLVTMALLPGICEEVLFRGAIQGILERRGTARGVVITAVLFGLFHLDPWRLIPTMFLGLVLGMLVVRTGSLVPAILAHVANNGVAVTVGYLFQDEPDAVGRLTWLLIPGFAVFAVIFWRLTRGRTVAPSPLMAVPAAVWKGGKTWVKAALLGAAAFMVFLLVSALVGFAAVLDLHTVEFDDLAPYLRKGDTVLVARDKSFQVEFFEGDVVSFQREEDETFSLGRIIGTEGKLIRLATSKGELEVPRSQVLGKVVYPRPPQ